MNRSTSAPEQVRPGFPAAARRRMAWIGAGWVLAALAEATAYTVLAVAIRDRGGVLPCSPRRPCRWSPPCWSPAPGTWAARGWPATSMPSSADPFPLRSCHGSRPRDVRS